MKKIIGVLCILMLVLTIIPAVVTSVGAMDGRTAPGTDTGPRRKPFNLDDLIQELEDEIAKLQALLDECPWYNFREKKLLRDAIKELQDEIARLRASR